MRYTAVAFIVGKEIEEWRKELFLQALADIGFDSFEEAEANVKAYIPTPLFNKVSVEALVAETEGVRIGAIEECPDENWNATWEAETGVQNIVIGEKGEEETVEIVPHCAFGAGYHETTSMLIETMQARGKKWMQGKRVLDNGCGTGILGIVAAKMGAAEVVAVDIDENSVRSTRENAERNGVGIDVRLGDTPPEGEYDLILSNIHRNILVAQMPLYAERLKQGGEVWMSGFYEGDCESLIAAAEQVGLTMVGKTTRGDWVLLRFR